MIDTTTSFRLQEIESNVFHAAFDTQRDLAHTLMRIQEYYEGASDQIRGKYFTLEQFLHHFTNTDGEFSYTAQWSGFNIPGHVVDEWILLFKTRDGLTTKEQQLIEALNNIKNNPKKWYLIATAVDSHDDTFDHERAHARYYMSEEYRLACDAITASMPEQIQEDLGRSILDMGYCEKVKLDEIQAYLSTSNLKYLKRTFKVNNDIKPYVRKFRELFDKSKNDDKITD